MEWTSAEILDQTSWWRTLNIHTSWEHGILFTRASCLLTSQGDAPSFNLPNPSPKEGTVSWDTPTIISSGNLLTRVFLAWSTTRKGSQDLSTKTRAKGRPGSAPPSSPFQSIIRTLLWSLRIMKIMLFCTNALRELSCTTKTSLR